MGRDKIVIVGEYEAEKEQQTRQEKMILHAPQKFNDVAIPKSGQEKRRERRKKKRLTKYKQ